jgi:hypothetical protein
MTNSLAYFVAASVMKKKFFMPLSWVVNVLKLFLSLIRPLLYLWVKPTQVEYLWWVGPQILDLDKQSSLFCCNVSDDEEKKFFGISTKSLARCDGSVTVDKIFDVASIIAERHFSIGSLPTLPDRSHVTFRRATPAPHSAPWRRNKKRIVNYNL